jgi:phenylpropionate dioxygenase-like ring-hydroxylating dioxygenase large terminal subunit
MLKNLWYVVGESRALAAAPVHVRVLGQDFVLFRDPAGRPALLSDICIHRGGSLSAGLVVEGTVECPYHGWRFAPDGRCVKMPAEPDARIPERARIDSYPVIERHGWVWAFLGDLPAPERPPLPDLSWVEDPELRILWGHYDWSRGINWERVVENGLDFAHAPFVHGTAFGDRNRPQIDDFEIVSGEWSAQATMIMHTPPMKGLWGLVGGRKAGRVEAIPGFHLSGPCVTLQLRPRAGWLIHLISAHMPVDEDRTRSWWIQGRSFMRGRWADRNSDQRNRRIFEQDDLVLRRIRPEHVPDGWREEVTLRSDGLQVAFRRRLREFEARGWKIDSERIGREYRGRRACVLPCPARRTVSSWVLETVPMEAVKSAETAASAGGA